MLCAGSGRGPISLAPPHDIATIEIGQLYVTEINVPINPPDPHH